MRTGLSVRAPAAAAGMLRRPEFETGTPEVLGIIGKLMSQ
eukprot:SAG31_NODE_21151_length_556_cov_2.008753_1_plen_39_part_01